MGRENDGFFFLFLPALWLWDGWQVRQSTWRASCSIHRLLLPICTPREARWADLFFLHSWDPHSGRWGGFVSPLQMSSTFDLCSSSGKQAQAGNSFSLAAPCSLQPLRYRQQTPKILCGQRAQQLHQEWDVPSVPTDQPWGRACCCGCWPWRMCSSSILYCHPVKYFIGHQHQDMLMAIYLLRQWLATQEKPCSSLESRTLSMMKLHLFPKMREGGGLVPQSSNQLLAWMESSC